MKLNIQKTKIMTSGLITSWEIDGETVSDFIFLGSNITADGDCGHEIKRCLLLARKAMTNLDSILNKQTNKQKTDHGNQSHHFMANRRGESGSSDRFYIFLGSKITAVTAATKLRLWLLGRKAMTHLESVLKNRDITLPTKVCIVKAMIFPLVIYGCESIRKDSDAGRDWGQEEKGTTEDEMAGWHH